MIRVIRAVDISMIKLVSIANKWISTFKTVVRQSINATTVSLPKMIFWGWGRVTDSLWLLGAKSLGHLWAEGRCSSSDIKVNGAIRDQPACAMLGQAAGAAAAQAIQSKESAAELNVAVLMETLRAAGVYLPQGEVGTEMTRSVGVEVG